MVSVKRPSGVVPPLAMPSRASMCRSSASAPQSMQETLSQTSRWNMPTGSVWNSV